MDFLVAKLRESAQEIGARCRTVGAMERRPLATRNAALSRRCATWLADRGVSPNTISVVGMIFGIAAGAFFLLTDVFPERSQLFWIVGAVSVQLRLLGNMFDGMVAILQERASAVGELYNEIPDRVSDAVTLIGFGFALGSSSWLGLVAALLAVLTAYVRAMGKVAGAHQEFCGPMAKPQRMFLVTIMALFLGFGGDSLLGESGTLGPLTIPAWTLWVIIAGCLVTVVRRLTRIGEVLRKS